MTTQDKELEILIHQLVGGWAIEHRMWMTDAALTEIERRIALALNAVECATAERVRAEEREACAEFVERECAFYGWKTHADIAAALRRSLD